jgi:hypothetical protein
VRDDDARASGGDVSETPGEPVVDARGVPRRHLPRGVGPSFDEQPLQFASLGCDAPIARFAPHTIAGSGKGALGAGRGFRAGHRTEPLVALLLMPVQQHAHLIVFRLCRC